jgi:hypothetical protein
MKGTPPPCLPNPGQSALRDALLHHGTKAHDHRILSLHVLMLTRALRIGYMSYFFEFNFLVIKERATSPL